MRPLSTRHRKSISSFELQVMNSESPFGEVRIQRCVHAVRLCSGFAVALLSGFTASGHLGIMKRNVRHSRAASGAKTRNHLVMRCTVVRVVRLTVTTRKGETAVRITLLCRIRCVQSTSSSSSASFALSNTHDRVSSASAWCWLLTNSLMIDRSPSTDLIIGGIPATTAVSLLMSLLLMPFVPLQEDAQLRSKMLSCWRQPNLDLLT